MSAELELPEGHTEQSLRITTLFEQRSSVMQGCNWVGSGN